MNNQGEFAGKQYATAVRVKQLKWIIRFLKDPSVFLGITKHSGIPAVLSNRTIEEEHRMLPAIFTTRSRTAKAESGLTLIELCIAVALLALIATMSYRGLDSISRTSDRMIAEEERWQTVALFFERFAADVSQPVRRPIRNPNDTGNPGDTGATAALPPQARWIMAAAGMQLGTQDHSIPAWWGRSLPPLSPDSRSTAQNFDCPLEFTRKSTTGRDEIRLGYRLRDSHLELLIWHVLDRAPGSTPEIFTVLEDVSNLHFRHLDASGVWQETWPVSGNNEQLPRAIEVEVTLRDGLRLRRVFALPS